ncbi:GNAT family N-acetyltransferase [Aquimarina rhabdastrellae]
MFTIKRTDATHQDFIALVHLLDQDLAIRDGDDHAFYAQYNTLDTIKHVVIAYQDTIPVGCGAIKHYDNTIMEVKRMFTATAYRGKGIASKILNELEIWTKELSYTSCILETGIKQPEAIALYKKQGYEVIPNYGQYTGLDTSICFKKTL